jgi:hypothetical protein
MNRPMERFDVRIAPEAPAELPRPSSARARGQLTLVAIALVAGTALGWLIPTEAPTTPGPAASGLAAVLRLLP